MHVYDFAKDETRTVSIYFEPQSGSFGEHLLTVITMLNTNFRAKGPIYDFGYNHRISFISDTIYFKQDLGESKAEKKIATHKLISQPMKGQPINAKTIPTD